MTGGWMRPSLWYLFQICISFLFLCWLDVVYKSPVYRLFFGCIRIDRAKYAHKSDSLSLMWNVLVFKLVCLCVCACLKLSFKMFSLERDCKSIFLNNLWCKMDENVNRPTKLSGRNKTNFFSPNSSNAMYSFPSIDSLLALPTKLFTESNDCRFVFCIENYLFTI